MNVKWPMISVFLTLFTAAGAVASEGVIQLGFRLEPLVDDYLIDTISGARLTLHHPTARQLAIVHDAPWEGNTCAYHTVFQDGDLFRMYYRGSGSERAGSEVVCYADSDDGVRWRKPDLGLFEFDGSKENNIVWTGIGSHDFAPFKDAKADCSPEAQYKAIGRGKGGLYAFRSPDGIHWSLMSQDPVITKGAFDSQNLAFWDTTRNRYVEFHRGFRDGVRDIMTCTSTDFLHWTQPVWLEYPGSPAEHLYTNQITPYYRAPHVFLGFPKRFVPSRKPPNQTRSGVSDGLFMTSRDGLSFKRWGEAWIRPGLQKERWVCRNNMTALGVLETRSAIPGTPNELSVYSTENYYQQGAVRLRRFTLRIDGFVSVQAPLAGGEFLTKPLAFAPSGQAPPGPVELVLNYSTSAAGSIRCEVLDEAGEPLPGRSLAECEEIFGDDLARPVSWLGSTDLSHVAGKPIRLRFVIKDADLYSIRFRKRNDD